MKTTREKLADFENTQAAKLAQLTEQCRIEDALPADIPWKVHAYPLYGMAASAEWEYNYYTGGRDDVRQPTLSSVAELARQLPPLPMVLVRDGCLSIKTRAFVDALPEEKKARWESETDIAGMWCKVSAFQHSTATFSWVTELDGMAVQILVTIPLTDAVGRFDIKEILYRGGRRIDHCHFRPNTRALTTLFQDGAPVAQLESPIKWGSGSNETPNNFTMYWVHLADNVTATAADIVDAITD